MKAIIVLDLNSEKYEQYIEELRANIDINLYGEKVLHYPNLEIIPLPRRVDKLGLEVWNSLNGSMLAPKGLFNTIYNDKEEDDKEEW